MKALDEICGHGSVVTASAHRPAPALPGEASCTTARGGHSLSLWSISHRFGSFRAADGVTLSIEAGELLALLGPSGCGKSTLLRIIAGFLEQSEGSVLFDDQPVDHLPPNRRGVGIVFQNYALFPHLTVAQNVAYGLQARRTPRAQVHERVAAMLDLVRMQAFAARFPRELSGGQQQCIALARALAVEPKILLLDEPFGALDKNLRLDMQIEIKTLQRKTGVTSVMVTHDQEEALAMADRIAVMNRGRIEQFATPGEIYDRPATLFVAGFVGTSNLLPGRVVAGTGKNAHVALDCGVTLAAAAAGLSEGMRAVVAVRPEHLRIAEGAAPGRVPATIRLAMPLGPSVVYELETHDGASVKVTEPRQPYAARAEPGERVFLEPISPDACRGFPAD